MEKKDISYNEAISEIEEILDDIENDRVEIDQLSGKVKRVSELLEKCKLKLLNTEKQIEKILSV